MEKESVLIDTVKVERVYSSGKGRGVFDTKTQDVCVELRGLKRFLHRRKKDVLFANEYDTRDEEFCYWDEFSIFINDEYNFFSTDRCGRISSWNDSIYCIGTHQPKPIKKFKLMSFIKENQKCKSDAELILQKDRHGKLYFLCDNKKVENLKVWLENPGAVKLERWGEKKTVRSDELDNLLLFLDAEECVEFSLQNVTKNIKQLNPSFNKKNSDKFTIYYFVKTKDSNGKYEFDSCETISLSQDKIGDKDAMLGLIAVHDGKPVKIEGIKIFIKDGDCTKFDFEEKNSTLKEQIDLLRENGFVELDVKRGTDKENDKYCVVYGGDRVDKTKTTKFDYTQMWANNSSNKINDINKHKSNSKNSKVKVEEKLTPIETLTSDSGYESESDESLFAPKNFKPECKSEESFTYKGTQDDGKELKAIKHYLDKKIDSQIRYANPNVVKDLNEKGYGLSHLEKKNCIIIDVSELCNSWVWRYKNNDKNLWFFQRWYAKFTLFFNIGKVAKILKWKEQYKNGDDIQQIKSSLSNNDNENNKIKNENEKREEEENMAALPSGYNDENNLLESNL